MLLGTKIYELNTPKHELIISEVVYGSDVMHQLFIDGNATDMRLAKSSRVPKDPLNTFENIIYGHSKKNKEKIHEIFKYVTPEYFL